MIKLVILDFDDTLCLTEEACFYLENEVAVEMGHAPMSRAAHKKNWGKLMELAIAERIPGIDAKDFMKRHSIRMNRLVSDGKFDTLSPSNLEALDALRGLGKKIAILTSRTFPEVRHMMHESHPLSKSVEKFYHKDNSKYLKPDPRVFEDALAHFGVSANEAVYVGDSPSDAVAAKGAGLHFIAVLESGLRERDEFANYQVDFFAQKFTDILTYIIK